MGDSDVSTKSVEAIFVSTNIYGQAWAPLKLLIKNSVIKLLVKYKWLLIQLPKYRGSSNIIETFGITTATFSER